MSRIHEALKKAESDRSAAMPAETVVATREVYVAPPAHSTAVITELGAAPSVVGNNLKFDELLARCARPNWRPDPNTNVFFNPTLSLEGAEQFRTLRSRLYQLRNDQSLHTILVTSSVPGEGKTFVSCNLGQAIVRQHDRRALIIDADLRRPALHIPLNAPLAPGLSDYLRGDADEFSIIQHGQEGGLCLIPAGNPTTNPSELLSSNRLKRLLDRVASAFDWIIIDSPPCLPVADASVIADSCDGILLVVKANSTPAAVAQKAVQQLQHKNVVGVVLNAVKQQAFGYGSYSQSDYYGLTGGPNN